MRGPSLDDLFTAAYEELRRLAGAVKRGDGSATLNPTALVNEAYIRLSRSLALTPESDQHFKRLAARAMRQVLIEAARQRLASKRGSGQPLVTFEDRLATQPLDPEQVIAIGEAIEALAVDHPRPAQVLELRYFSGYDNREIAGLLAVSESAIDRDLRFAKAQLKVRLRGATDGGAAG